MLFVAGGIALVGAMILGSRRGPMEAEKLGAVSIDQNVKRTNDAFVITYFRS